MNDLEHELRELLESKSRDARLDPVPTRDVLRRARLRQAGVAMGSAAIAGVVMIGTIAGLQALLGPTRSDPIVTSVDPRPATTLPAGVTVTYPRDWVLVDLWPLASGIATSVGSEGGDGPSTEEPIDVPAGLPVLQLSNQDLGLASYCRDGGTPSTDEALLYVALDVDALQAGRSLPAWPVEPAPESGPCGEGFYAHWLSGDRVPYLAYLGLGPEAALPDRDVLFDTFESLRFGPVELPASGPPSGATPGYVLDSLESGDTPRNLELRQNRNGSLSLALVLPNQPEVEPILVSGFTVPGGGDIEFTVTSAARVNGDGGLTDLGMIVFGVASERVATVEIRMDDGTAVVADLIPFPASLEEPLRAFVAQPTATGPWHVVAFDADGQVLHSESFAAGVSTASPAL